MMSRVVVGMLPELLTVVTEHGHDGSGPPAWGVQPAQQVGSRIACSGNPSVVCRLEVQALRSRESSPILSPRRQEQFALGEIAEASVGKPPAEPVSCIRPVALIGVYE